MLLSRTQDANADIVQRGVYIAFNADLGDPAGWSPPVRVTRETFAGLFGVGPW